MAARKSNRPPYQWIDLTGRRFGKTVAVAYLGNSIWQCICDCGRTHNSGSTPLRKGRTGSCGCSRRERFTKHGQHGHPLYVLWAAIKNRCLNPNCSQYLYYGAKGITIWSGWIDDLSAFANHIGPRPSLKHSVDRIDNSKGYEPGNVRWATAREQALNRTTTKRVVYRGETMSLYQLAMRIAAECEIPPSTKALWTAMNHAFNEKINNTRDD